METRTKPFIIIIVLGVVGFMFWLYAPSFDRFQQAQSTETLPAAAFDQLPPPPPPPPIPDGVSGTEITATHTFADGKHTISGTVRKNDPCDTLTTAVSVGKSKPEAVELAFLTKASTGVCQKTSYEEQFSLSFTAGKDAVLSAVLNGKPTTVTFK